jgi:hypothetical protein
MPLAFVPLGTLVFRQCGCGVTRLAEGETKGSVLAFVIERCPVHQGSSKQAVTLRADEWVSPLTRPERR